MNLPGLIFLVIAHYLCGRGLLRLFKLQLPPVQTTCLSFILGVPLVSFAPCFTQLFGIPITFTSVFFSVALFTLICCIPLMIHIKRPHLPKISMPEIYEWPFLLVSAGFIILSVWRCYYYPPTPRDMLAGPELLAEYAVREKTMTSSVFHIDLHTTNNYFKSPYITCLQIIYKLLVQPFGQLWMSILYIPFIAFIYTMLRERLHPFLASMLLFMFVAIPDLFAYSFVMLYDYSNMVFFFCGFYFLTSYLQNKQMPDFVFSAFLFGIATYIRVETVILAALIALLPLYVFLKERTPLKQIIYRMLLFTGVPVAFYLICIHVFVRLFVPVPFHAANDINHNLGDISYLWHRFAEMNTGLIFATRGISVYGYFMYLFLGVLFADIVTRQRFNREARFALFGIVIVYVGMPLLGYLLPLFDINNTTKRGLFKILPIMLLYLCNSGLVLQLSGQVKKWEFYKEKEKGKTKAVKPAKK